jgi:hypothetical protein
MNIEGGLPCDIFPLCGAQVFIEPEPSSVIVNFGNSWEIEVRKLATRIAEDANIIMQRK